VYEGIDLHTGQLVVIKTESSLGYLQREALQYDRLGPALGFPKKIWYGTQSGRRILVLEFLEMLAGDVQKVLDRYPQCFTPDLVAAFAIQMVSFLADSMFHWC
jgi:hypothetical protein